MLFFSIEGMVSSNEGWCQPFLMGMPKVQYLFEFRLKFVGHFYVESEKEMPLPVYLTVSSCDFTLWAEMG
jgi:hypothetical protein